MRLFRIVAPVAFCGPGSISSLRATTRTTKRGLLKNTLVVWMGEFGRTPRINVLGGRDHFSKAWSAVLAGGRISGGRVLGKTSADGNEVVERPVSVPELFATFCKSLGISPGKENYSGNGRPLAVTNGGKAIAELFT